MDSEWADEAVGAAKPLEVNAMCAIDSDADISLKTVKFGDVTYPFYVASEASAWAELQHIVRQLAADRFIIIADEGVPASLLELVQQCFGLIGPCSLLTTVASEQHKTLNAVDSLAEEAIRAGVTRKSCIVALGGGVVGNMAGLVAGLLFRGIRLIHIPTTLLAMSDSVLSTKQGVNSRVGKNHLGVFHPPTLVWCHLVFLESLPVDDIKAALCEMIKNVVAIQPEAVPATLSDLRPDGQYDAQTIRRFIDLCIEAKTTVMRDDVREKNRGLILEYGHTIGHAIELLSKGSLRHGYAVGLGMLGAARISKLLGLMSDADEQVHLDLLAKNGAPVTFETELTVEEVFRTVSLDNKRGYLPPVPGKSDFVLLEGIGRPMQSATSLITQVDNGTVLAAIDSILRQDLQRKVA